MTTKTTRVAIYLRVSMDDCSQRPTANSCSSESSASAGRTTSWWPSTWTESRGTRAHRESKDFDRMFAHTARRCSDVRLYWPLDRFSREGIRKTIAYVQRLSGCGVSI
jgi:hypothetical protein